MTERGGELLLGAVIIAVMSLGLTLDLSVSEAGPPDSRAPATTFSERAVYCPPAALKNGGSSELFWAGSGPAGIDVAVEPIHAEAQPLAPGQFARSAPRAGNPVEIVGYGGRVAAGAIQSVTQRVGGSGSDVKGRGAGNCAAAASDRWYFPAGAVSIDVDERIIVANPFPDEAVVRIRLLTPAGEVSSAKLRDIPVPSGEVARVVLNDSITAQRVLSVMVDAQRGRVVAWKGLASKSEENPDAYQFTLGAPASASTWYFPEGGITEDVSERITVMNPTEEEARVTISLQTAENVVQARDLVDIAVAPLSSENISIADALEGGRRELGGVSAFLQSTNGIEVVAERTVINASRKLSGIATEVGVTAPATHWIVSPAALNPASDVLVLMSPGGEDAVVRVSLLAEEGPASEPPELQDLRVEGGLTLRLRITAFTQNQPRFLEVFSDEPIVVERVSMDGTRSDVGSVMGQPAAEAAASP